MIRTNIKKVFFGRLKEGDDLLKSLENIVKNKGIKSGSIQLIGSLKKVNVGYYDREKGRYVNKTAEGVFELVSCMGDISWKENSPVVHIHMAVSSYDGKIFLGHVLENNIVDATVEYVIFEFNKEIHRKYDESTRLHLLEV